MKSILTSLFILFSLTSICQSDSVYQADLEALYSIIKKTQYIPYENYGVKPGVQLSGEKDWIEQVIKYIGEE